MLSGDRHAAACALAESTLARGEPVAWLTVVAVRGSAPREVGACQCVSATGSAGSIGGGALEWQAMRAARALLDGGARWVHESLGLGPALGQCCGGRVSVLIERLDESDLAWLREARAGRGEFLFTHYGPDGRHKSLIASRFATRGVAPTDRGGSDCPSREGSWKALADDRSRAGTFSQPLFPGRGALMLFGAGHLAHALVPLLQTLPLRLHWIDSREHTLPPPSPGLRTEWLEAPELALRDLEQPTLVVVMTHDHRLDYRLCSAALGTPAATWVGLVGSASKRRSFERRWRLAGRPPPGERLACPLAPGDGARDPASLALQIAAEICRRNARAPAARTTETLHVLP